MENNNSNDKDTQNAYNCQQKNDDSEKRPQDVDQASIAKFFTVPRMECIGKKYMQGLIDQLDAIFTLAPGKHEIHVLGLIEKQIFQGNVFYKHGKHLAIGLPSNTKEAIDCIVKFFASFESQGNGWENCVHNLCVRTNSVTENFMLPFYFRDIGVGEKKYSSTTATKDENICAINSFVIDIDRAEKTIPRNEAGIELCASNADLLAMNQYRLEIVALLSEYGLTPTYQVMTGNGYQVAYFFEHQIGTELVEKAKATVGKILGGLKEKYFGTIIEVDTTLKNPSRLTRLACTANVKITERAEQPPERVFRVASLIECTKTLNRYADVVRFAETLPDPEPQKKERKADATNTENKEISTTSTVETKKSARIFSSSFDSLGYVRELLSLNSIVVSSEENKDGGLYLHLTECLFDSSHSNAKCASFFIRDDGMISYKCQHESCNGKYWADVKNLLQLPAKKNSVCKFCGKEICFQENREHKFLPKNLDGTSHRCTSKKRGNASEKEKARDSQTMPYSKVINTIPAEKGIEYSITPEGVYRVATVSTENGSYTDYALICKDVVQIAERYNDLWGETAQVKLTWGRKEAIVPESWLSGQELKHLTEKGIRIQSPNAKAMSEYFLACLNAMPDQLTFDFASRNGWLNAKCTEFIYGNNIINESGTKTITYSTNSDTQVGKSGSKEEWKKTVQIFSTDPLFQFVFGASVASPLLEPFFLESQVIHLFNDSSAGKSIYARIAATLWGKAKGRGEIIAGWNATRVGPEQYFAMMNNLPSFLDDSQEATSNDYVRTIAQSYVNGKGRTRGGLQANGVGFAKTPSWHGFLISTGEKKITDGSKYSGLSARTVEIFKPGTDDLPQSIFIDINQSLQENYGFGDEVISYFLKNRISLKEEIKEISKKLESSLGKLPKEQMRAFGAYTAILAGASLANKIYGIPYNFEGIIEIIQNLLSCKNDTSKGSQGAYEFLMELYASKNTQFGKMVKKENGTFCYDSNNQIKDEIGIFHPGINAILFYPETIGTILEKQGYSISQVGAILKEKGLLVLTKGHGNRYVFKKNGVHTRVFAVKIQPAEDQIETLTQQDNEKVQEILKDSSKEERAFLMENFDEITKGDSGIFSKLLEKANLLEKVDTDSIKKTMFTLRNTLP